MSVTWLDGVTPLNAVNMSKLVMQDNVVTAAVRLVATSLLAGDANPAFRILGDGTHSWGAGGASAPDTTLSRSAAGILKAAQHFRAGLDLYAQDGGATQVRIGNNGGNASVDFGSAMDTRLYRNGVGVIATDGWLKIGANTANEGIRFYDPASNGYGAIWRSNADGSLNLQAQTSILLRPTGAAKIWISNETGVADTNLYRVAAGMLKTDGALQFAPGATNVPLQTLQTAGLVAFYNRLLLADANAAFQIHGDGKHAWGPGGATPVDTNLYRSAAAILKTDGALEVFGTVKTAPGTLNEVALGRFGPGSVPALRLGTDATAMLYQSATGIIKTDGKLNAVGGLQINGVEVPAAVNLTGTYLTRPAANTVAAGTVYFATDTLGAWRSDGSTWTLVAQGSPVITASQKAAAPFTTPYDGQRILLSVDTTNGIEWEFIYRAASLSTYKWEFVGGPAYSLTSVGAQTNGTTVNTWINICSSALSAPVGGEYLCGGTCVASIPTAGATVLVGLWVGSLPGGIQTVSASAGFPTAGGYSNTFSIHPNKIVIAGGNGLAMAGQSNQQNATFTYMNWSMVPIRIF